LKGALLLLSHSPPCAPVEEATEEIADSMVELVLVRNLSAFSTLFAPGKSWDKVRSTTAPYTESRLTRSVANERVGFPVVEHPLYLL
jgi:hypothetical protein